MARAALNSIRISNLFPARLCALSLGVLALFCTLSLPIALRAQPQQAAQPMQQATLHDQQSASPRVTSYTLPPDLYRKAHLLGQIEFWGAILSFLYSVGILLVILRGRVAAKFRDWAERAARIRFLQALIFVPLVVGLLDLLTLPIAAAEHWIAKKFALSVQGWPSWFADWSKAGLLEIGLATFLVWILYAVIRHSPRRWWFYFWLVSLPIVVTLVFLQPLFVDPLFHKFEPLESKNPALAAALEKMVQRSGEDIPVSRMYWMGASEKSNELNAYVTGVGASKRIVVWDTTIAKMNTPATVFVVGHEMGHYALNHIAKGLAASALGLLVFFYFSYRLLGTLLARCGRRWSIRGVDDWASLPALLLLLTIFGFAASPVENAFSRYIEHQADQYGLEVTHGLTPDSSQVAAQSFQVLGELDLADPAPNPLDVFLFYSHPPIADRIRFALTYDPWAHTGHGQFVP